ncbi:MAG: hypothetical protein GC164_08170 [Phycisphaera sp.]|nr:hypothetical protein [Phycisphaera sp.]
MTMTSLTQQTAGPAPMGPPSLKNHSEVQWHLHGDLAYMFARHVRHDLVNLHCSIQMMETVEKIRKVAGDAGIPPELAPDQVALRVKDALRKVVSMSNDMTLLAQAANPASYKNTRTESINDLLTGAILNKTTDEIPTPDNLVNLPERLIVCMGDSLIHALSSFYFQWTPWNTPHTRAAKATAKTLDNAVRITIPSDDTEHVASFARNIKALKADATRSMVESPLTVSTTELALWLARFIVELHGGEVNIDPNDPELAFTIYLPTTR